MSKFKIALLTLCVQLISGTAHAAGGDLLFYTPDETKKMVVNNRILAKVNNKAISVYDVMKKLDMHFYRRFPEFTSSVVARYQFYTANWKQVLQDLIERELIMADAEELKIQVTAGEVRQEMEELFGPNVHQNLDKVGLTFTDAWKMIQTDIMMKRVIFVKAQSKALKDVTPLVIRETYEKLAVENKRPEVWTYRTITVRDASKTKGAEAAHQAHKLLVEDQISMEDLPEKIKELASVAPTTKVTISEEFTQSEKEISPTNKTALAEVAVGSYSQPLPQKSRQDGTIVYRIFFLKENTPGGIVPLSEVEKNIKNMLLDQAIQRETETYLKKLHKHFDVQENHVDELTEEGFEPFSLG